MVTLTRKQYENATDYKRTMEPEDQLDVTIFIYNEKALQRGSVATDRAR